MSEVVDTGVSTAQPVDGVVPEATETQPTDIKKYKVKIDGEELEVDEAELLAGYQTRKAADKKFQEAAITRKQAEEFISLLKTDPVKVLSHPGLGVDFRQLAEQYLVQQLEEEMLDPRDRELKKYKAMVEEQETLKKQELERQQAEQAEQLRQRYTEDYTNQIVTALQTSGLPKTERTVKAMAQYMHLGLQHGVDLKAAEVVELVKQDYINAQKELFAALDGDTLLSILGEDVANKIRKSDVKRLKSPEKVLQRPTTQPPATHSPKTKGITKDEWRERLERLKRGEE